MEPPRRAVDHRPLTERLRPAKLTEMVGNERAVAGLRAWGASWSEGRIPARRAAVLAGPPGVGKTTAALALANEMGWNVVELNASDARNQSAIEQVAGRASLTHTLGTTGTYRSAREGGRPLILLDEADCLTGRLTETPASRPTPPTLREFLRARYGSVEALGQAWGLGRAGQPKPFESWESVPASAGRAAWTKLPAAQSDLGDWRGSARPKDLSDRGGLGAIARLVRETRQPVILTVNDERPLTRYSPVFRSGVARFSFGPVADAPLRTFLRRAVVRADLTIGGDALDAILRRARGDVRAAINDLEAIAPLPPGPGQAAYLAPRDSASEFEQVTEDIFRHPRVYRSVEVRDRLDATPDDLFPWIEENLPRFAADPAHRYRAYELLGRAELLLARARRQRVWALWSYASELMTGGVSLAASEGAAPRATGAFFPSFLADMGRSRIARAQRTAVSQRVGRQLHVSRRKANDQFLPWAERLFERARLDPATLRLARRLAREWELTPEEVAMLLGVGPDSPEVATLVAAEPAGAEAPPAEDAGPSPTNPPETRARERQRRLGEF